MAEGNDKGKGKSAKPANGAAPRKRRRPRKAAIQSKEARTARNGKRPLGDGQAVHDGQPAETGSCPNLPPSDCSPSTGSPAVAPLLDLSPFTGQSIDPPAISPDQLTRADMRLLEQAARHRWPMTPEFRQSMTAGLQRIFHETDDQGKFTHTTRERLSASRALAQFDKINLDAELGRAPSLGAGPVVQVGVTIQQVIQQVGQDPEFVEYARAKAVAAAQETMDAVKAEGRNGQANGRNGQEQN